MAVSEHTRKALWARSGNRCSICKRLLVVPATGLDREAIIGEECHIRARSSLGPRGLENATEQVDHYDNLLLLCPNHHREVDNHRNTYTIEWLRTKKAEHEQWVQSTIEDAMHLACSLFTLPSTHRKNPYFIQKKEVAAALRSFRASDVLVLSGPPGIGKTQQAVQHAHETRSLYSSVLWASAESMQTLHQALAALADQLLITDISGSIQQRVAAFQRWLAAKATWLLILDNADLPEVVREIEHFIPPAHHGYVLITSRLTCWTPAFRMEPIGVWTESESSAFLTRRLPQCATATPSFERLARELGGLPLAVEQAAAYITETWISATDYLELLNRDRRSVLGLKYSGTTDYRASVAATWLISVRRLSWLARQILHYVACLAAEPVPRSILSYFAKAAAADHTYSPFERRQLRVAMKPPDALNLALAELGRFSLVSLSEDSFRLHPLLQQVVLDSARVKAWQVRYWRYWMFAARLSKRRHTSGLWLYRVGFLLNLKGVLPEFYGNHTELLKMQLFIGHLQALSHNIKTIAPELQILREGAWIGGVAPLNNILEWAEGGIKRHRSGMSALRKMLEGNAHRSPDLISETEWFLSNVEELFGQVAETSLGKNLTHILRRLAGEDLQNPERDLYHFLEIMAREHADTGAIATARRLFHLYRAHAMKDPNAPTNEVARSKLQEALSLRAHMPNADLPELLEEALVSYERDEGTNLSLYRGIWIYAGLAETPESQLRALAWIKHALPNARKMLDHGCEHACALTEQYLRISKERGELNEALPVCEETLRRAIKSRKLARDRVASLWEQRGNLLGSRRCFVAAARSYARCLALEVEHDRATPFRRIYLHYMTAAMHLQAGSVLTSRTHVLKINNLLENHWADNPQEAEKWAAAVDFTPGPAYEESKGEASPGQTFAAAPVSAQIVQGKDGC